ncbi:hypothetical protein EXIGLDRAFT_830104 [Exidia glandulosa HHB12029]|uniref:Uncharacterized protein n=1 Tax=Exidia glandulosa HHB12029 TaxID=1314781 RepID=A0A165NY85_EXIGL|nr:hypothetical protein EXIGLDRAFT_830104 [Exidia glandulosa HHB12029]
MIQLPSELLVDVFILACGDSTHRIEQKLHLAQVCAYWRAVALAYPTFWAHIGVRTSRDAALLPIALAYSGDCALDVALSWQSDDDKKLLSSAEQHAVVDVLLASKQRRRIKRLYVEYSDAPLVSLPRLLGARVTFSALEILEFKGTSGLPFDPCLDAPSLCTLVLDELFDLGSWDTLLTPSLEHLHVTIVMGSSDAELACLLATILRRCTALRHLEWNVPAGRCIPTMSAAMQGTLALSLDTLRLGIHTPSSDVLRLINQFRTMDPIRRVAVTVKSGTDIYGTTLPAHFLENVFFRMDTLVDLRYDDTREELVVRDNVGRIRRLILSDSWTRRWNITYLWSALARLHAIDTSLRSLHMRSAEWHGFAGAFASRPPTALTEVHVLLRHGIDVKLRDLLAEGETFDPATDTLPPPRTLHLPSPRKLVIAKDGVSDRLMWGTVYTYCVPDVTRVRDILQHIEKITRNGLRPAVLLSWT